MSSNLRIKALRYYLAISELFTNLSTIEDLQIYQLLKNRENVVKSQIYLSLKRGKIIILCFPSLAFLY